jgi:hypothetical protein
VERCEKAYATAWIARHAPSDGKPPIIGKADRTQLRATVSAYGEDPTLAWIARFVSDADRWLTENRHPLRCLPREINKYRGTTKSAKSSQVGYAAAPSGHHETTRDATDEL